MLVCVVNVSEGRDLAVVRALATAAGPDLLDVHTDPDHHRSVFTLAGEAAPRRLTVAAVERVDLGRHEGVHPRVGAVDVVPFVPMEGRDLSEALAARAAYAAWAASELGLPCFFYGPERSLPEVRRQAFGALAPDAGPPVPHPTAGAVCVGARLPLVAYNVVLARPDATEARRVATAIRGPHLRALGFIVGERVQVSMNLVEPELVGPAEAYDAVAALTPVAEAELVGLVPAAVLARIPPPRWPQLDLGEDRTFEARLASR